MVNEYADMSVGPKALEHYARLSYTMWHALAEFVDNSTQSRQNYESIIDDVLKAEGQPLTVDIVHNRHTRQLSISDNSIGMSHSDLIEALKIANPTSDSVGRSQYGMGMKTAACWIGRTWKVVTTEWGSGEELTAEVDVDGIANHGKRVPITRRKVDQSEHGTTIIIQDLRRRIQSRTEETIKAYLSSIYTFDLKAHGADEPSLRLTYNGDPIGPMSELEWDTDPNGNVMKRELPTTKIGGKTVSGWYGVLKKGGRKYGGFSLYQNLRQIQGYPNAWKPKSIYGGVDSEGANNLVTQRLTGVLLLEGFVLSHTKDTVLYEDEEEEQLERLLVEQTKDFVDYARKRRGKPGQNAWSKEKVRSLLETMRGEFTSEEMKDAISTSHLPPIEAIQSSNVRHLEELDEEDEVARLEILPGLTVVVSLEYKSEWEPHLRIVTGAQSGTIHVIVNGLHSYYSSLESSDSIEECLQQYIYDAVAEYQASKLQSRINPDSVRYLKNNLLRVGANRIENLAAEERYNSSPVTTSDTDGDDYEA